MNIGFSPRKYFRKARRRMNQAALYAIAARLLRNIFRMPERSMGRNLFPPDGSNCTGNRWIYHDQEWCRVRDRWEHRAAIKAGRSLTLYDEAQAMPASCMAIDEQHWSVSVPAGVPDRWVYLYLSPTEHYWRDFQWEFVVVRHTDFRELQFGFRYCDFYNRYRIRHEDQKWHLDIVYKGQFFNDLDVVDSPMELGVAYRCVLRVVGYRFQLRVNDSLVLDAFDPLRCLQRGSVAIILWDEKPQPAISADVTEIRVCELLGAV